MMTCGTRGIVIFEHVVPMAVFGVHLLRPQFLYGAAVAGGATSLAMSTSWSFPALAGVTCWYLHHTKRLASFVTSGSAEEEEGRPLEAVVMGCATFSLGAASIAYPLCSPACVTPSDDVFRASLTAFVLFECALAVVELINKRVDFKRPILRAGVWLSFARMANSPGAVIMALAEFSFGSLLEIISRPLV
jgi:hypothetical protein